MGQVPEDSHAVGQDVVTPLVQEDKPKAGLRRWPQSVSTESSLPEGEAEPKLLPSAQVSRRFRVQVTEKEKLTGSQQPGPSNSCIILGSES